MLYEKKASEKKLQQSKDLNIVRGKELSKQTSVDNAFEFL